MAFNVARRDVAMLRLRRAGISDDVRYMIDNIASNETKQCIFNRMPLNGSAVAIKRACSRNSCASDADFLEVND